MLPIRRDLRFKLPAEKILDWHGGGRNVAHFMNTLSIVFPVGERFFIDAVRKYRDDGTITDPKLLAEVRAFIGQEAMHGREHEDYNAAYAAVGSNALPLERGVLALLNSVAKYTPKVFPLAGTIALEHYTAILANALLEHPELIADSDASFQAVWNWHALEETEHKAVAFDVYREVMKDTPLTGYAVRVFGMVVATVLLWSIIYPAYVDNVRRSGDFFNLKAWRNGLSRQFGKHGILRVTLKPYLDYFRPGFHPWDHDNRHFLSQIDAIETAYAKAS